MAIVDRTSEVDVSYAPESVYLALFNCDWENNKFSMDSFDDTTRTIFLKSGASMKSWGENITVSVHKNNDTSKVVFLSTPKTGILFGGLFDMGKNRENIRLIMSLLSEQLEHYETVSIAPKNDNVDAVDQIKKYAELRDLKIITQEEFEKKKSQLLSL